MSTLSDDVADSGNMLRDTAVQLKQGSIVWVEVHDQAGRNPKCRPAVVVTPDTEINGVDPVFVVAATTTFSKPLPANTVALPWHASKHPVTGLKKECVAVCDWIVEIQPSHIQTVVGRCPVAILTEILRRLPIR